MQRIRDLSKYENHSQRFVISAEDLVDNCFRRQYYHLYRTRINKLRARIISSAKEIIIESDELNCCQLTMAEREKDVLVVGTIMKRIKLRPSVLRDLASEDLLLPQPVMESKLATDEDYLEFEDENQIVRLKGSIKFDDVATGCVVGLYGRRLKDDVFDIYQVIYPLPAIQPNLPSLEKDRFVMFISGLSFSEESEKQGELLFTLDLLQKWICGYLPLSDEERYIVENLSRLVIAGESIAITDQSKQFHKAARYLIRHEESPSVECAANMDKFLSRISNLLEVDIMPGVGDPATHLQPQQPIHRAVFPLASKYGKMLNLVTNPYDFTLDGIRFLGTSGANVSDLKRYSIGSSSSNILKQILHWQHLMPNAPDTADCFPFVERDPFIIEDFPHVLFAGNQITSAYHRYKFDDKRETLLLSIPSFAKTHSAILLNLRTLEVTEHNFFSGDDLIIQ